jgi:preprotein translocase subunit SecG
MLHTLLVIIHILVCIVLASVVLLQSSKGGGLAGAFGGGGGSPQQMLGSRGMTSLLHKLTIYFAVAFFATSFLLFMTQDTGSVSAPSSVMQDAAQSGDVNVPASNPIDEGLVPEEGNSSDGTADGN